MNREYPYTFLTKGIINYTDNNQNRYEARYTILITPREFRKLGIYQFTYQEGNNSTNT
ncbi:MAG: hypothetical protein DMENIID0002_00370 [Rickettsia endosymbiont of Sergentomyia squamirostris]|uniref:Uncharacterized protein n=1 Tax=Candidatus Tisiphia endosymbiont of Sergentomyia squamirostris TaxID=3113639 RepID=A0AAT9G6F6_9RICK